MSKWTKHEIKALNLIPKGDERLISVADLAKLLKLDVRTTYQILHSLTVKHHVAIGAYRKGHKTGIFRPTTEEERERGLASLQHQVDTMNKRLRAAKKATL